MIRVGINGFGRIGRNIFRILADREDIMVTAVCDPANPAGLEYLLKYDTILGRFPHDIRVADGHLYMRGRQIVFSSNAERGAMNWGELGVDIVVEATGKSQTRSELEAHLEAGAKHVVLCAPPVDAPDKTIVMGINDNELTASDRIISNSSITAHCAAPIVKMIDDAFGAERIYFTSVHAYTNDQRLADVPANDLRRSRAASLNIIPTETGSAKLLEKLFPKLEDKISGLALKVPVPNGSLVDMTIFTEREVSATAVNEVIRTGASAHYPGLVSYSEDPIVSSDVKISPYSCTYDSLATQVLDGKIVKTLGWFDNGWGYAHRAVELMSQIAKVGGIV